MTWRNGSKQSGLILSFLFSSVSVLIVKHAELSLDIMFWVGGFQFKLLSIYRPRNVVVLLSYSIFRLTEVLLTREYHHQNHQCCENLKSHTSFSVSAKCNEISFCQNLMWVIGFNPFVQASKDIILQFWKMSLFGCVMMVVASKGVGSDWELMVGGRALIRMRKSRGLSTEFWGTPYFIMPQFE
jgi:hypothetical protein